MKNTFALLLMCLWALLTVIPATAQDDQTTQPSSPRRGSVGSVIPEPKPINLEFPGGTATEYINSVRKVATDINIVIMADLSVVQVPQVSLKNVNPASAIEILKSIPQDQSGRHVEISLTNDRPKSVGQFPVLTVSATIFQASGRPQHSVEQTTVSSISDLLDGKLKAADLLTAVQTALEMLKSESAPAQIRFHDETGLLIARGSEEQISTIRQVLQQVREKTERDRSRDMQHEQIQNAQTQQLQQEVAKAKADLDTALRDVAEWRNRSTMFEKKWRDYENYVQSLQAELDKLKPPLPQPPKPQ